MKAAVYYRTGPPDVLLYEEVPDPVPGPGQVAVRVQAISIEGGDVLNRAGGAMPATPHIVGYQAAGVVARLGEGVEGFRPGDRVVAFMWSGSHASVAVAAARHVYRVPEGFDIVKAAVVPVAYGTAHDCLFEYGRLKSGETVLIQGGASGVGVAAIQLAKRAGARVLATASGDDRAARLTGFGADLAINYQTTDVVAAVKAATDGRGADLIVDPIAGPALVQSLGSIAYRGRITLVGTASRDRSTPELWPLMRQCASLIGVFLGGDLDRQPERTRTMIERLIDECASGKLPPVIDRIFPLSEAAAAHAYVESRRAVGRVVLVPDDERAAVS
ncbi:MAG TPA: NADPH:quinone oxidoreductase family protein [Vicinamibacterales bacterium]|jgi:NADPH2:quinone reductase